MTTATEIMLRRHATIGSYLCGECNMKTNAIKTDMEQLVRILIRNFEVMNFGRKARYIYLPTDLYNHFTDRIEDQFRKDGLLEHALDAIFRHFYHGVEVVHARTNDIIVTDELLP